MQNITSLPPPDTPWILSKNVLNEAGLNGELHLLAPGPEQNGGHPSPGALVVFVIAGSVTVTSGLKNFILQPETTLHPPPGSTIELRNRETPPAKVLVVTLPPPPRPRSVGELVTLRG